MHRIFAVLLISVLALGCQTSTPTVHLDTTSVLAAPHADAPVEKVGQTFTLAQKARWLDEEHIVIARWDGTLAIFRRPKAGEYGPVLVAALRSRTGQGVEMVAVHGPQAFVSSNNPQSLLFWHRTGAEVDDEAWHSEIFEYPSQYGIANSGLFLNEYLVTGHALGYVLIWRVHDVRGAEPRIELLRGIDVRSPDPIDSPYPLSNIREVAAWRDGIVVAGSEDGDVTLIRIPTGEVLARRRFNPKAQRGINDLAVLGDHLLVVNCSVGEADDNTWLFHLLPEAISPLDSINLKKDPERKQSFAFNVAMAEIDGMARAWVSTQEGLLWSLALEGDDQIRNEGFEPLGGFEVGNALDYQISAERLVVAGPSVFLFKPVPSSKPAH